MRVGIAIDAWKLPIFERHLKQAGYTHTKPFTMADPNVLYLRVDTANVQALGTVIKAANTEAANQGQRQ